MVKASLRSQKRLNFLINHRYISIFNRSFSDRRDAVVMVPTISLIIIWKSKRLRWEQWCTEGSGLSRSTHPSYPKHASLPTRNHPGDFTGNLALHGVLNCNLRGMKRRAWSIRPKPSTTLHLLLVIPYGTKKDWISRWIFNKYRYFTGLFGTVGNPTYEGWQLGLT